MTRADSIPFERHIRAIQNPLVTIILLFVLFLSLLSLPDWNDRRGWSVVGCKFSREFRTSSYHRYDMPRSSISTRTYPIAWIIRSKDTLSLVSMTEPPGNLLSVSDCEGLAAVTISTGRAGFWAITSDRFDTRFDLGDRTDRFSSKERRDLRAMAADFATSHQDAWLVPYFKDGDTHRGQTLWLGWLHNAGALAAAIALILSLGWIPNAIRAYLTWRTAHLARQRDLCPNCKYPFAGLPGPICPECGHNRTPADPDSPAYG